jgi:hypothetical protein
MNYLNLFGINTIFSGSRTNERIATGSTTAEKNLQFYGWQEHTYQICE